MFGIGTVRKLLIRTIYAKNLTERTADKCKKYTLMEKIERHIFLTVFNTPMQVINIASKILGPNVLRKGRIKNFRPNNRPASSIYLACLATKTNS